MERAAEAAGAGGAGGGVASAGSAVGVVGVVDSALVDRGEAPGGLLLRQRGGQSRTLFTTAGARAKKKKTNHAASGSDAALADALAQIERSHGKGSVMKLGSAADILPTVDPIRTGSLGLDQALGVGGLPRGRVVEVYGPESSGKTTLALHVIAEAQRLGGKCTFVDAEHALDPGYARALGVDIDELYISQPDSGEQALEIADTLSRSGAMDVVVVDSVAALVPKTELEGDMGDAHMALQARLMSQALRKMTATLSRSNTLLIFINQIRSKIGVLFGSPEVTAGGNALKFYASVRMDIRRTGQIKDCDGAIVGNTTRVKIVKNKVAPPFRETEFDMMYGRGICRHGELVDIGCHLGLIRRSGAWYSFAAGAGEGEAGEDREEEGVDKNGYDIGVDVSRLEEIWPAEEAASFAQGKDKARAYLQEHKARADLLEELILAAIARRRQLQKQAQEEDTVTVRR